MGSSVVEGKFSALYPDEADPSSVYALSNGVVARIVVGPLAPVVLPAEPWQMTERPPAPPKPKPKSKPAPSRDARAGTTSASLHAFVELAAARDRATAPRRGWPSTGCVVITAHGRRVTACARRSSFASGPRSFRNRALAQLLHDCGSTMSLDLESGPQDTGDHTREELLKSPGPQARPTPRERAHTLVHSKPLLDKVLRDEADFANRDYAPFADELELNASMFDKYAAPSSLWDWRQMAALLLGELTGKELLDYGCGMGEEAVYLTKLGARVTAIDISEVGVASLKKRAAHHQLDIRAFEMRCDPTSFLPCSFDRIHGMGILHHIGIEALAEVWRLLRPGGIGVFLEPMGDVRAIEAAKTFLMKRARFLGKFHPVTDHEHNLRWEDIATATKRFSRTLSYPYHLLYRLRSFIPEALQDGIRRFDHGLLSMAPGLRRYVGAVVIQVIK